MNTYKINFAKNTILSCEHVGKMLLNSDHYYEHDRGQLIFALVHAENELEAINKAYKLIKEFNEKIFGSDFVT